MLKLNYSLSWKKYLTVNLEYICLKTDVQIWAHYNFKQGSNGQLKKLRFLEMVVMESGVCLVSTISTKFDLIWFSGIGRENWIIIKHYTKHMLNTVGRFSYTKY
jgi:hypothetical protein